MVPDPTGRSLMTNPGRPSACSYLHGSQRRPSTDNQGLVFGEEILIQAFELNCPAGADSDPMLNHEVCQVLAIE
jgi:hypothetical protein